MHIHFNKELRKAIKAVKKLVAKRYPEVGWRDVHFHLNVEENCKDNCWIEFSTTVDDGYATLEYVKFHKIDQLLDFLEGWETNSEVVWGAGSSHNCCNCKVE